MNLLRKINRNKIRITASGREGHLRGGDTNKRGLFQMP